MTQQEYIKKLRNALQALYDEQNGAPLIRREMFWKAAMFEAERLLAIKLEFLPVIKS